MQPIEGKTLMKLRDLGIAAGATLNLVKLYSEFEGECEIKGAVTRDKHLLAVGMQACAVAGTTCVCNSPLMWAGAEYDLTKDGAFKGEAICVLDLYGAMSPGAIGCLEKKGFNVWKAHVVAVVFFIVACGR